jgi:hypothetical protein
MRMIKAWFKRGFMLPVAAVCSLLVPLTAAQAALVSYSFTGNFDGDPLGLAPVTGTFQFDKGASSGGTYNGVVTGMSFTIGSGALSYTSVLAPGANAVTISQNTNLGGGLMGDRWALVTAATGPQVGDYTPFRFDLRFDEAGGGFLSNTDLQDPPSLATLSAARWRLMFEDSNGDPVALRGSITSLTAVPLPAAVLLFGAGLISLVGLGAGGLRNLGGSRA